MLVIFGAIRSINNRKGKQPVLKSFNASAIDDTNEPNNTTTRKIQKYKGPYARHGVQFKERRLASWVSTTSDDSNDASDQILDESDFDCGNRTSNSDQDMTKKETLPHDLPKPKTKELDHPKEIGVPPPRADLQHTKQERCDESRDRISRPHEPKGPREKETHQLAPSAGNLLDKYL
ncbi:hypothetical protein LIER_33782 [Lithospermum erythrorhizon]|uniref:Uncharacterized protein n=1 Tax=Lithospermum erythrorhizon TaxID=34254 RepID=A0AAV3RZW8_LITER